MKTVDTFLAELLQLGGSDLHIPAGCAPMVRLHGELEPLPYQAFDADYVRNVALEILSPKHQDELFEEASVDFIYEMEDVTTGSTRRFRSNAFFQKNGLNLVFRAVGNKIPTIQDLG
ncbi:MAG TPA: type IV pili twitching motility protein PilT, partial [Candidatus Xenobia bacterium]